MGEGRGNDGGEGGAAPILLVNEPKKTARARSQNPPLLCEIFCHIN